MNRTTFWLVAVVLSAAVLVLDFGHGHAQTPGRIPVFDQPGTGSCNATTANNCVDSVITQDASGNIGIGTSTPQNLLHVGPGASSIGPSRVNAVVASNSVDAGIAIAQNSGVNVLLQASGAAAYIGTTSQHALVLRTNDVDRMSVDINGNVGIGTGDPVTKLRVVQNISGSAAVLADNLGANGLAVIGRDFSGGFDNGVGVSGTSINGVGVSGTSDNDIGVVGTTGQAVLPGIRAISANGLPGNLGLEVRGRFFASGTKNAIVPLQDGQHVLLTAEESTEVWFSDYGSVQLVNGRAAVQIDRVYLQTVNTEKDYHVFLTARGNPTGALYIDHETPSSFEIRESTGTANIKVSYRIVAKRKDFADERLKKVEAPLAYRAPDTTGMATAQPDLQSATRTVALP